MQAMKIKNTFFKLVFLVLFFFPGAAFSNHYVTAEIAFTNIGTKPVCRQTDYK
jgi:hypothetical protein